MLYLVATPIGNLGDISLRALETLRSVDLIAAEDTRKTGRLLKHHGIDTPQFSYHEHNEEQAVERIVGALRGGRSVAVVTNAGTPGISDPGFTAVRRAVEEGLPVSAVPGPTGLITALVLSGLPLHSFTFRGFAPRKTAARRRFLEVDVDSYGDRPAAVANDLTKLHERVQRGTVGSLLEAVADRKLLGEFIVVIGGCR